MRKVLIGIVRGTIRGFIRSKIRTSALAMLFSALPMADHAGTKSCGGRDQFHVRSALRRSAGRPLQLRRTPEEVTLNGTISSVLAKASPGMIPGSHLLLVTVDGAVDVSLGTAVRQGAGALSLNAAGQQVEVVGVMKTIKQKQVFLTRSVQAGSRLYVIRNQHGIPVSPIGRERTIQNAGHFGDTL